MATLTQADADAIARRVVLALCGGRFVSPPVAMTDEVPLPPSGVILLSGRPVVSVQSVKVDGVPTAAYTLRNGFVLTLTDPAVTSVGVVGPCYQTGRTVAVSYTYGLTALPVDVLRAITVLSEEMMAAANGNVCRIPERITSVTRQGVSWTVIDPGDFLDKGRTGIYEIDIVIGAINPARAKRRARVFSPSSPPPARIRQ